MIALRGARIAVLASVLTIALVGGTVTAGWADEVSPPESPASATPDATLVPSEPSEPAVAEPVPDTQSGDFTGEPDAEPEVVPEPADPLLVDTLAAGGGSELDSQVRDFDEDSAQLLSRSEFESTYANDDGTRTTLVSPEPVNIQDDGEWVPIETDVQTTGPWSWLGIGGAAVDRHPLSPEFAQTASDANVLTMSNDDHSLGFTLQGAAGSSIVKDAVSGEEGKSHIEYRDVFPSTDLLYDVTTSGVKENFKLSEAPGSDGRVSWTWDVSAPGLDLRKNSEGAVEFTDAGGDVVFVMPTPNMWDSSGVEGERTPAGKALQTSVMHRGDTWMIAITADRAWLNSPARVFPVMVDPTTSWTGDEFIHAYKSNGMTSYDVQVGNSNNGGFWRTVLHYNYEQFFGKQVVGAGLWVSSLYSDSSSSAYGVAVSVATNFSYNSKGEDLGGFVVDSGGGHSYDMRLQNKIAEYVRNGYSGGYLVLNGDESPGVFTYKHMTTALQVDWKEYPTLGSHDQPAANATRVSLKPTLSVTGVTSDGYQPQVLFRISTSSDPASDGSPAYQSDWTNSSQVHVPDVRLQPGVKYYWTYWVRDTTNGYLGTPNQRQGGTRSFTTNTVPLTSLSSASPADKSIVVSTSPTLSVAVPPNPENRALQYWFRVASGSDAKTGAIVSSGWQTGTSWTVPANTLQDGGAYTWTVLTKDEVTESSSPWVGRFTVNQRVSSPGPAPTDSAGPVTVNLANGNAGLSFTSPTVSTLGGPMGLSFTYNSQKPSNTGLRGEYFDATEPASATTPLSFDGRSGVLVRTDPNIEFDWGWDSPTQASTVAGQKPLVPADRFLTRWTGFITLPAGTYTFGGTGDDGFRAWVGSTQVLNDWADQAPHTTWSGSTVTVPAGGQTYAFKFEYYEATATAQVKFQYKTSTDSIPKTVPAAWFTRTPQILPTGWGGSSVLTGSDATYVRAEAAEAAIKLTDVYGTVHSYTKRSAGGYEPPAGESGVVALDTDTGAITFTDAGGTVHVFAKDGSFVSATSPTALKKPSAPVISYRSGTTLIEKVSDPLSVVDAAATPKVYTRSVTYSYSGDSACTIDSGFAAAPTGMLCQIGYPDGTVTKLQYDASGNVVRIVNPGNDVATFVYDSKQRLTQVRSGFVNDWLAADLATRTPGPANRTDITYDTTGKVSKVELPAPDGVTVANRPTKTYTYASGTSYVDVSGLSVPAGTGSDGHAVKAVFNASFQTTSTVSAEGLTAQTEWNSKDQQLWSLSPQGLKSTTLYDGQDRVTDTYGPAPASCFGADRKPVSGCAVVPAHTSTRYDEGLKGLDVQWWNNGTFTGAPTVETLGFPGVADGTPAKSFGAAAPLPGFPVDMWTMRATGLITFSQTGTYFFNIWVDDGIRLWIDDVLILENWTVHGSAGFNQDWKAFTATAGQTARIRIEFGDAMGDAQMDLNWKLPGQSSWSIVPGAAVTPNYGLTTSTTTDDSVPTGVTGLTASQVTSLKTSTGYTDPVLGLATSSTVDPGGLNLTTTTQYESSTLYNRPISVLSPADQGSTSSTNGTSNAYWTSATSTAACGVPAGSNQFGMLKTTTVRTTSGDISTDYVYDVMGRTVGTKKTGDTGWSCVTRDSRGRTTSTVINGPGASRTVTNTYATATGDPLTTTVQDNQTTGSTTSGKITTVTDLLGRTVSTTDVWGTVTANVYNVLGQVTTTTVTSGTNVYTTSYTYSLDGRVETVSDNGKLIADPTYAAGLLASVSYPAASATTAGNGTQLASITRDAAGRDAALSWTLGTQTATDTVVRSQSGRIIRDQLADPGTATPYTSTYTFDTAGRLTSAAIPGHTLTYGFSTTNTCGVAKAGANGNRTTATDVPTGGSGLTYSQQYCYDKTDRLLSETETITGATASNAAITRPAKTLAAADITYDAHRNVTKLGDQTFVYDSSDRHTKTTLMDGTVVTYVRDVSGNIVSRTHTPPTGPATTTRYSGSLILSSTNTVVQRNLSLPGGVTVTLPTGGAATWAYPNLHGDITWTADTAGTRTGFYLYDPFGQPIDLTTKIIGSAVSDEAVPDLQPGDYDLGWVGSKGKGYEHAGSIATIEMGVRMYVPFLGRFLAADPVAGGNSGWYNYPNDPINMLDLNGDTCSLRVAERGGCGGAKSSTPQRGYPPSSKSSGTGISPHGKQAALNAPKVISPVVISLPNLAWNLNTISTYAGIAATITEFIPPLAEVSVGLAVVSIWTSQYSAGITCSIDWGSSGCSTAVLSAGFGMITLSHSKTLSLLRPANTWDDKLVNQFYSGGLFSTFTGAGFTFK